MDDKQIVELYWQRCESAIKETDKKYGRYCHYIAYHILADNEDAKEIVNDTYLKTWNTVPPQRPDPLKSYVGMISRRLALDAYEAQHTQKRGGEVGVLLAELSECIPDRSGGADIGESVALRDALNRFVRSLPDKTGRIFVRRYWYGDSLSYLSDITGYSENNISQKLFTLRSKLKKRLLKGGFNV